MANLHVRAWIGRSFGVLGLCLSGTMLTAHFGDTINALDSVVWNVIQVVGSFFTQSHGIHYEATNAYWSNALKALTPLLLHIIFGALLLTKKDKNTEEPFIHHRKELLLLAVSTWFIGFYVTDWVASGPLAPIVNHGVGAAMAICLAILVFV